jgi:ABC-2 type transport system ATP-binding protein
MTRLELKQVLFRHRIRDARITNPFATRKGPGIHSVDLKLEAGTILGLVGPNGAGKTTLMRVVAGLFPTAKGQISLDGQRISAGSQRAWAQRRIGMMPERVSWTGPGTPRSVLERLVLMRNGDDSPQRLLKLVGLANRQDQPLNALSQGMRQRLSLASALLGDPSLLLLDEPLNGLDPVAQAAFRTLLRRLADEGCAIIVSSHQLNELERLVDRVAILNQGRMVIEGTLRQIERTLGIGQRIDLAGSGSMDEEVLRAGLSDVTIEQREPLEGEGGWRVRMTRSKGNWGVIERTRLLIDLIQSGCGLHRFEPIRADLEEILAAVTGLSAEEVSFEVQSDALLPLREWEVDEDE